MILPAYPQPRCRINHEGSSSSFAPKCRRLQGSYKHNVWRSPHRLSELETGPSCSGSARATLVGSHPGCKRTTICPKIAHYVIMTIKQVSFIKLCKIKTERPSQCNNRYIKLGHIFAKKINVKPYLKLFAEITFVYVIALFLPVRILARVSYAGSNCEMKLHLLSDSS